MSFLRKQESSRLLSSGQKTLLHQRLGLTGFRIKYGMTTEGIGMIMEVIVKIHNFADRNRILFKRWGTQTNKGIK